MIFSIRGMEDYGPFRVTRTICAYCLDGELMRPRPPLDAGIVAAIPLRIARD